MKVNATVDNGERYTHCHVISRYPSTGKLKFCRPLGGPKSGKMQQNIMAYTLLKMMMMMMMMMLLQMMMMMTTTTMMMVVVVVMTMMMINRK